MATSKPISTISYNTEPFLKEKLDTWVNSHIIQAYQYICHKGEDGDKDHIHLRIEPNKVLDPMNLMEELRQYVKGNDKPLGCRPFRPSKEEDWILYAVHDIQYLNIKYGGFEKGEKLPYKWEDIQVPDFYDIEIAYIRAKAHLEHTSVNMASKLKNGETPLNLVLQGENVHTVNAITHALYNNDYSRVVQELERIKDYLNHIEFALTRANLELYIDDKGNFYIMDISTHKILTTDEYF